MEESVKQTRTGSKSDAKARFNSRKALLGRTSARGEICGRRWQGTRPNLIYTTVYRTRWALSIFGYGLLDYKSFRLAMQAAGGPR